MSRRQLIPLGCFTIALIACVYVLLDTLGILHCFHCNNRSEIVPILGSVYFVVLLFLVAWNERVATNISPYGLFFSIILALYLQSQLSVLCIPCFVGHIAHVGGWCALTVFRNSGVFLSIGSLILVSVLPLLYFAYRPITYTDLHQRGEKELVVLVSPGCIFCEHALKTMPKLQRVLEQYRVGLQVYGMDDVQVLQKLARPVRVYQYEPALFSPELKVQGYPVFVYVNEKGYVQKVVHGYTDPLQDDVMQTLKALGWESP